MTNIPFIKSKTSPDIFDERTGRQFLNPQDFFQEATKYFGRPVSSWETGLFREVPPTAIPKTETKATYQVPDIPEQPSVLSSMTKMLKAITKKAMEKRRTGSLETIEGKVGDISKMQTSTLGSVVDFVNQAQEAGGLRDMYTSTVDFFNNQQTLSRQNLQLLLNSNALSSLEEKDLITLGLQAGLPQKQIMALTESQKANTAVISSYINGIETGVIDFDELTKLPDNIKNQVIQKIDWTKMQEAEDKKDILSPSEAKLLGIPYGTTKKQAEAMGIIPDTIATGIVADLAQKYPDAMIGLSDSLEQAQIKVRTSRIYQQATRLAGGGGDSTDDDIILSKSDKNRIQALRLNKFSAEVQNKALRLKDAEVREFINAYEESARKTGAGIDPSIFLDRFIKILDEEKKSGISNDDLAD